MNGVLLADEMGTGKSIQAIAVCNAVPLIHRVLIVCPAFLKDNWFKEFSKWDVKKLSIEVVRNGRKKGNKEMFFPASDVVIVNYELLSPWRREIREIFWDIAIFDEVHYPQKQKNLYGLRKFSGVANLKSRNLLPQLMLAGICF